MKQWFNFPMWRRSFETLRFIPWASYTASTVKMLPTGKLSVDADKKAIAILEKVAKDGKFLPFYTIPPKDDPDKIRRYVVAQKFGTLPLDWVILKTLFCEYLYHVLTAKDGGSTIAEQLATGEASTGAIVDVAKAHALCAASLVKSVSLVHAYLFQENYRLSTTAPDFIKARFGEIISSLQKFESDLKAAQGLSSSDVITDVDFNSAILLRIKVLFQHVNKLFVALPTYLTAPSVGGKSSSNTTTTTKDKDDTTALEAIIESLSFVSQKAAFVRCSSSVPPAILKGTGSSGLQALADIITNQEGENFCLKTRNLLTLTVSDLLHLQKSGKSEDNGKTTSSSSLPIGGLNHQIVSVLVQKVMEIVTTQYAVNDALQRDLNETRTALPEYLKYQVAKAVKEKTALPENLRNLLFIFLDDDQPKEIWFKLFDLTGLTDEAVTQKLKDLEPKLAALEKFSQAIREYFTPCLPFSRFATQKFFKGYNDAVEMFYRLDLACPTKDPVYCFKASKAAGKDNAISNLQYKKLALHSAAREKTVVSTLILDADVQIPSQDEVASNEKMRAGATGFIFRGNLDLLRENVACSHMAMEVSYDSDSHELSSFLRVGVWTIKAPSVGRVPLLLGTKLASSWTSGTEIYSAERINPFEADVEGLLLSFDASEVDATSQTNLESLYLKRIESLASLETDVEQHRMPPTLTLSLIEEEAAFYATEYRHTLLDSMGFVAKRHVVSISESVTSSRLVSPKCRAPHRYSRNNRVEASFFLPEVVLTQQAINMLDEHVDKLTLGSNVSGEPLVTLEKVVFTGEKTKGALTLKDLMDTEFVSESIGQQLGFEANSKGRITATFASADKALHVRKEQLAAATSALNTAESFAMLRKDPKRVMAICCDVNAFNIFTCSTVGTYSSEQEAQSMCDSFIATSADGEVFERNGLKVVKKTLTKTCGTREDAMNYVSANDPASEDIRNQWSAKLDKLIAQKEKATGEKLKNIEDEIAKLEAELKSEAYLEIAPYFDEKNLKPKASELEVWDMVIDLNTKALKSAELKDSAVTGPCFTLLGEIASCLTSTKASWSKANLLKVVEVCATATDSAKTIRSNLKPLENELSSLEEELNKQFFSTFETKHASDLAKAMEEKATFFNLYWPATQWYKLTVKYDISENTTPAHTAGFATTLNKVGNVSGKFFYVGTGADKLSRMDPYCAYTFVKEGVLKNFADVAETPLKAKVCFGPNIDKNILTLIAEVVRTIYYKQFAWFGLLNGLNAQNKALTYHEEVAKVLLLNAAKSLSSRYHGDMPVYRLGLDSTSCKLSQLCESVEALAKVVESGDVGEIGRLCEKTASMMGIRNLAETMNRYESTCLPILAQDADAIEAATSLDTELLPLPKFISAVNLSQYLGAYIKPTTVSMLTKGILEDLEFDTLANVLKEE